MDLRSAFSGLLRRTCLLLFLIAVVSSLVGWFTWSMVTDVEHRVAPVTQTTSRLQRQLAEVEALAGRLMLADAAEAGPVETALNDALQQADVSVRRLVDLAAGDGRERLKELDGNLATLRQARTTAMQADTTADAAGTTVSQAVTRTVEQVEVLTKTINDLRTGLQAKLRQAESNYRRCNQAMKNLSRLAPASVQHSPLPLAAGLQVAVATPPVAAATDRPPCHRD
jgi:chromosome segregation ATPase